MHTWHAVVAFQGWSRLARDGVVGPTASPALTPPVGHAQHAIARSTVATTVLVGLGLYLILVLEAVGLRRRTIVSLAVAGLAALYVAVLLTPAARGFFELAGPDTTTSRLTDPSSCNDIGVDTSQQAGEGGEIRGGRDDRAARPAEAERSLLRERRHGMGGITIVGRVPRRSRATVRTNPAIRPPWDRSRAARSAPTRRNARAARPRAWRRRAPARRTDARGWR